MKLDVDSKVLLPLLLSLVLMAVIFIAVMLYNGMPSSSIQDRESLVQGLTDFYGNDYYNLADEEQNQYCDVEMRIWTENNSVLVNSHCIAEYPSSVLEAFKSVARGNITADGSTYYTHLDWDADKEEEFRAFIQFMEYPSIAALSNATTKYPTYLYFVPFLDDKLPSHFDVLSVEYEPDTEQVSEMFQNYDLDAFKGFTFQSNYEYLLYYDTIEHNFKWRYLIGRSDVGRFELEIEVDKPILRIEDERDDVQALIGIPKEHYEITEINENRFLVSGSATGIDKLVVEW